jgi:methylated-DNA-[protein]-cysteine S-methyltransferase
LTIEINTNGSLVGVSLPGWHRQAKPAVETQYDETSRFDAVIDQLHRYFQGHLTEFELPRAPEGHRFHQDVWALLEQIPYGETRSYGEIAETLGDRSLARAVGAACAANPIAIIVPCHRVLGADGGLTGFGGGLKMKAALLHHENPARFPQALRLFN